MVALVQASVTLPLMLLSLVAGAMADNLDRRKVMLGAQTFMLVVSIGTVGLRLDRIDHAVAAAAVHVPDRLRRGVQRSGVASVGRRHGAARASCPARSRSTAWASTLRAASGPRSAAPSSRRRARRPRSP